VTPEPTRAGGAAVDTLLDPCFLDAAVQRPMADVRRLRRQAEQEEVNLSYTRRLLQGRLDIVRRELQRRTEHDGRSLVDLLPEILARRAAAPRRPGSPPGRCSRPRPATTSLGDGLTPDDDRRRSPELPGRRPRAGRRSLAAARASLSERRRGVQQVMDTLAASCPAGTATGEADVAALLADEGRTEEGPLSSPRLAVSARTRE
jgi:hypothetical protein